MKKILVVARREFRQKIRSHGFLIGSIAVPLIFLILWVAGILTGGAPDALQQELTQIEPPDKPIGYVDKAGLIQMIPDLVPPDLFKPYPDVETAQAALRNGELEAYYRVPADYRQSGKVYRVSSQLPAAPPDTQLFDWILAGNLLSTGRTQVIARALEPFNASSPQFVDLAGEDGQAASEPFNILPFLVTFAVIIPLFTSGGYLFQSLAQEKGNRIMEVLLSSLQPREMLTGKLLGLGALTAVQYGIWIVLAGAVLAVSGRDVSSMFSGLSLGVNELLLAIPFALGGYLLYASLMAGIGALSSDMESSRVWVFILTLPMLIPIWFWSIIAADPNGPVAVALSLIPYSAPVAMLMRMTSTTVPTWQLGLALLLLLVFAILTVGVMARLFRVQTLLSGESFSLGRAWSVLTG